MTKKSAPPKRWELTDESKAKIPAWNKAWRDIIMSTDAMTGDDRSAVTDAIHGMFEAAKLPHSDLRVVFVPSPLMAAVVAGAAAACWYERKGKKTKNLATRAATDDATDDATAAATDVATDVATRVATRDATDATDDATDVATADATDVATAMMAGALSVVGDTPLARSCIENSWRLRNGGNHWAAWCSYLSFVRDVVGFACPQHEAYAHYETCATRACWRYTHEKFVIVSDRPCVLKTEIVRGVHRLHCEDGPAMAFRDGWCMWCIHGVKVDEQIVLRPETQTLQQIASEPNNDIQAIRIERFGWIKYLEMSGAKAIDRRNHPRERTTEVLYQDNTGRCRLVVIDPSTEKRVALGVPRDIQTCAAAQAWITHGSDERAMCRT